MVLSIAVNQRWSLLVAGLSTAPHFLVQHPYASFDECWRLHKALCGLRRSPAPCRKEREKIVRQCVGSGRPGRHGVMSDNVKAQHTFGEFHAFQMQPYVLESW